MARQFFLGVVGNRVAAARSLGVVHRCVSATQQLSWSRAVFGKHGNADACRDIHDLLIERKSSGEHVLKFRDQRRGCRKVGGISWENRELVAAKPGDGV